MKTIKACPFCGQWLFSLTSWKHQTIWQVVCVSCDSLGPQKDNPEDAVTAWNERSEAKTNEQE
jgi:Lar family restriction alleviation protein